MNNQKVSQRGASMLFVLIFVGMLAYIGLLGAQVFPTYMEYLAIQKALKKIADANSVAEIRKNFDLAAVADDIKTISGKDLEIPGGKVGDKYIIKYAYTKEIHLFGPAYLVMKYSGQTP